MLILTRKKGEWVYIDGTWIRVVVLDVKGEQVKLGFEAPPSVPIYRQELYDGFVSSQKKKWR